MTDSEIELKLRVEPEDLARLAELPVLAGTEGKRADQALESVYYDTEDLALRRRAVSLRVRHRDGTYVQTLKLAGDRSGPLFDRGEWEVAVPGPEPDPDALGDGAARDQLAGIGAAALRPVFRTRIQRTTRLLDGGGSVIEAAIDSGEIRTADGVVEPVSELELELKQGQASALYGVALAVAEAVPVRLERRTKADRGYDRIEGERPEASKAPKVELPADASVEEAFERVLRHCMGHLLANERCALASDDPEGIHQMRVALRRLRSAMSLFRGLLPPDPVERLSGEVEWLAGALGPARDWDVFLGELVVPVEEAMPDEPALAALRAAAQPVRAEAYDRARAAIRSPRYAVLLLRLGALAQGKEWRRQDLTEASARLFAPLADVAPALLDRRRRVVCKRGARFARLSPDERHRVRIAAKKLRYAGEFFRSLYEGKACGRYLKSLAALQEALGHWNDVASAGRLIGMLDASGGTPDPQAQRGAGVVLGWHARGLRETEPDLLRAWKRFAAAKPFWTKAG